jgi:hypothetical protein
VTFLKKFKSELIFSSLTWIRFLEVESVAWTGLEETAGGSPAKHHVGAVCRFSLFFPFFVS